MRKIDIKTALLGLISQIASIVSDVFGKSAQKIIQSILDTPKEKPDIASLVYRHMKASVEELELSMDGEQAEKLRVIKAHYDAITSCKNDLEEMITKLDKEYAHQQALIQTVPGFKNPLTALRVLSEIGIDMDQFPTAGHLYSWAGVVPANNESAGKKNF